MMVTVHIICDICGELREVANEWKAHGIREMLRKVGWAVGLPGGRDICPKCRKVGHP